MCRGFFWSVAGSAGRAVTVELIVRKTGSIESVQLHYDTHNGSWADMDDSSSPLSTATAPAGYGFGTTPWATTRLKSSETPHLE